jgi:hypothetical protein
LRHKLLLNWIDMITGSVLYAGYWYVAS